MMEIYYYLEQKILFHLLLEWLWVLNLIMLLYVIEKMVNYGYMKQYNQELEHFYIVKIIYLYIGNLKF